ncbi:MAG: J domain-containing protein [Acetatifactor sp.]|nr:J domain-containing protein [Acetatifactor sp.]
MNIWEILGIERTTDLKEIKRAYARRAKQWHPEEYPEEFQRLQNAYKWAKAYAQSGRSNTFSEQKIEEEKTEEKKTEEEEAEEKNTKQEENSWENAIFQPMDFDYSSVEKAERRQKKQEQFWKDITYMIMNPWIRNNSKQWEDYFNLAEIQELFEEERFRFAFVKRICQEGTVNWHRRQIRFFDEFLKQFEGSSPEKATASKEWIKLRKKASRSRKLLNSPCITAEEKRIYREKTLSIEDMQKRETINTLRWAYLGATKVRKSRFVWKRVIVTFITIILIIAGITAGVLWRVLIYRSYDKELKELREEYEQSQTVDEDQLQTEFEELMREYEKYMKDGE